MPTTGFRAIECSSLRCRSDRPLNFGAHVPVASERLRAPGSLASSIGTHDVTESGPMALAFERGNRGPAERKESMKHAREWRWVTADAVVGEVLCRFPTVSQILIQHGGMFHARKGDLYANYAPLTVAEYASRSGVDVEALLGLLNAAAETDQSVRGSYGGPSSGPHQPRLSGRGTSSGYTGAYREPVDEDIQEVVAVQTARGPE